MKISSLLMGAEYNRKQRDPQFIHYKFRPRQEYPKSVDGQHTGLNSQWLDLLESWHFDNRSIIEGTLDGRVQKEMYCTVTQALQLHAAQGTPYATGQVRVNIVRL